MTTLVKISTATALAGAGLGYAYYSQQKTETPKPKEFPKHFDPHPFQHLSQQEIDARLRSGQIINKSNAKWVKAIYTNRMASNDPVEDNYSVNTFQGSKLLAGVYDGKVGAKGMCINAFTHPKGYDDDDDRTRWTLLLRNDQGTTSNLRC